MTKPPAEKRVLAWDGKQWVRAIWVERHTKEAPHDDEFDDYDYCEAYDEHFWFEGWYEVQSHGGEEMLWRITGGVQEWREMPAAPSGEQRQDCEPIYQLQMADGSWIDQTKTSYDYNLKNGHKGLRIVYAAAPKREPLRDETIANLVPTPCLSSANVERWSRADMVWFARALERAHGIGGQS